MILTPELKRKIKAIMKERSPEFLMKLKKRISKIKKYDSLN